MGPVGLYAYSRYPNYFVSPASHPPPLPPLATAGRPIVECAGPRCLPALADPFAAMAARSQGEMCVWAGLFVAAGPTVLLRCPWVAVSPLFTFLLIRYMSGEGVGSCAARARVLVARSLSVGVVSRHAQCGATLSLPGPPSLPGVPPLERSNQERYGGQPQYEQYKAATNLLWPWPPRDKFP